MASGDAKNPQVDADQELSAADFARVASVAPTSNDRSIPLDRIIVRDRLRAVRPGAVEAKRVSMRESGQISPIMVRPEAGQIGWYALVVGAHRVEAARLEGWSDIKAELRQLTDDEARLIEVDENLISEGLSPLDRAAFIEERLRVWARLHPERVISTSSDNGDTSAPKRGRPKNSVKLTEFIGDTPASMGFSDQTAEELGLSPSTIERALRIAKGLSLPARAQLADTKIAKNEGLLRQLAGVADRDEQLKVVEALVRGAAKTFGDALQLANGRQPAPPTPPRPVDEVVGELKKLWKKAKPTERAAMLDWLSTQSLPGAWTVAEASANG